MMMGIGILLVLLGSLAYVAQRDTGPGRIIALAALAAARAELARED